MFSVEEELMCRFCEQPLASGAAVCHSCGSLLEPATDIVPHGTPRPEPGPQCPNCQASLEAAAEVCHSCGSLLVGEEEFHVAVL